jgi:hypothetical protein
MIAMVLIMMIIIIDENAADNDDLWDLLTDWLID